ncbi:MAG: hypothetical protein R3C49_05395 [Planctomycetaceae bacterium]
MTLRRFGNALRRMVMSALNHSRTPRWAAAWEVLSRETGAEIIPPTFLSGGRFRLPHNGFVAELTTWASGEGNGTRIESEVLNSSGFDFLVRPRGRFEGLRSLIGGQPFLSGDQVFDKAFDVTGSSEADLTRVMTQSQLREAVFQVGDCRIAFSEKPVHESFRLTRPAGSGIFLLVTETQDAINNVDRLRNLLNLHTRFLDILVDIGVAEPAG